MLQIKNLHKIYENGQHALKGVDLDVTQGEFLVIIGLSGSGKSTLLRCINGLVSATSGSINFDGTEVVNLKNMRPVRSKIGMIFQHFNLIPRRTVLVNVLTGLLGRVSCAKSLFGVYSDDDKKQAYDLINLVGLKGREEDRADKLSGGQQQRVAIARALMQSPKLLLADEPVASLDPATSGSVMDYLKKASVELGVTVICNLHFLSLVRQYATRVIALKSGEIVYQGAPDSINDVWFKRIYGEDAVEVTIK